MIFDPTNLKALRDHIAQPPAGAMPFNMGEWFHIDPAAADRGDYACGTSACLAGHAVMLLDPVWAERVNHALAEPFAADVQIANNASEWCPLGQVAGQPMDPEYRASELLGLTDLGAGRLFFSACWPSPYRQQYEYAETDAERRAAAVALMDALLEGEVLEWAED